MHLRSAPSVRVKTAAPLAMFAFAANSLLTRRALDGGTIDAASFATIRLGTGAIMLTILVRSPALLRALRTRTRPTTMTATRRPILTASMLFLYAACFTFAYLHISAATGALLVFGTVQVVMYGWAISRGERLHPRGWFGIGLALLGLVALLAPGVTAPDPVGSALMIGAGTAWAVYTIRGRSAGSPLLSTAANFLWAMPFAIALCAVSAMFSPPRVSTSGMALATVSGVVTSALGYALWYSVLPKLTRVQAGVLQLSPAPIAAIGGLLMLGEAITLRVALASILVLSGVSMGLLAPKLVTSQQQ